MTKLQWDDGNRVLRGGSWSLDARYVRCANRYAFVSVSCVGLYGFRPVAEVNKKGKKR